MNYLEMFIEDCKYYDPRKVEIKTILKNVNLKGKTILDIGAGIGRLSFPLSKFAKKVIALDKDKRFKEYFEKHKKKNLDFVNIEAEKYLKKNEKFDIILLAWPTLDYKFIKLVKNAMHENSLFIFITCDNNSDFETLVDKIGIVPKDYFKKDIKNKEKFLQVLPKEFGIKIKKKLNTEYIYPDKKMAFKILKNSLNMWFNIKLNKKSEFNLNKLIDEHKQKNKIIFKEEIWFYLMKLK